MFGTRSCSRLGNRALSASRTNQSIGVLQENQAKYSSFAALALNSGWRENHRLSSSSRQHHQQLLHSRSVWSTGQYPSWTMHPLGALTPDEISLASDAVKQYLKGEKSYDLDVLRFVAVSLKEPPKEQQQEATATRQAEVVVLYPPSGIASELTVDLSSSPAVVNSLLDLARGVQPLLTPEDCDLAEEVSKSSKEVQDALKERYGITDMSKIAADPWSVHIADSEDASMTEPDDASLPPRRLVQTFLYARMYGNDLEDNHYAHPIDILPVVDLNTKTVVRIDGLDRPAPQIPADSVNYHRNLVKTNSYLQTQWRSDTLKQLDITQPDGPSFRVTDNNLVEWQNWSLRVGFNYREGPCPS
jgi:primary-amine oxidase